MPSQPSFSLYILAFSAFIAIVSSQATSVNHVDSRCNCRCPEAELVDADINPAWPKRKIYINSSVSAVDCDCEHVVVPVLSLDQEQLEKFCPRCKCTHEVRSVTTIKVVVILILWLFAVLLLYLVFLVLIDPLLGGKTGGSLPSSVSIFRSSRGGANPYRTQEDEAESINDESAGVAREGEGGGLSMQNRGVVNRLGVNQERWKRQVEIQRSTVYDRHSMLN